MLDLTTFEKLYELKWFDGEVIKIRFPSHAQALKMAALGEITEPVQQLEVTLSLVLEILNKNTNERVFTIDDVSQMESFIMEAFIEDYFNAAQEALKKS